MMACAKLWWDWGVWIFLIQVKCRILLSITQGSLSLKGEMLLMICWANTIQDSQSFTQPRSWHNTSLVIKRVICKGVARVLGSPEDMVKQPRLNSHKEPLPPTLHLLPRLEELGQRVWPAGSLAEMDTPTLLSSRCPAEALHLLGLQAGQGRVSRAKRQTDNIGHNRQRKS